MLVATLADELDYVCRIRIASFHQLMMAADFGSGPFRAFDRYIWTARDLTTLETDRVVFRHRIRNQRQSEITYFSLNHFF